MRGWTPRGVALVASVDGPPHSVASVASVGRSLLPGTWGVNDKGSVTSDVLVIGLPQPVPLGVSEVSDEESVRSSSSLDTQDVIEI